MHGSRALLVGLSMITVTLAGCSSDDAPPIEVEAPEDPVTQPFLFKANAHGERFVWDFGDGSPLVEGKEVEHTFGFTDGRITVSLTAVDAGHDHTFTEVLTLGSGQNTRPEFVFEASTDWSETGDLVRFSGAASTDADGDPLLFEWLCTYTGRLATAHGHDHGGGGGGVAFPSGGGLLQGVVADGPLPEPDRKADGAFCDAFGESGTGLYTRDATVEGTFDTEGTYEIIMLARDPKSPAVSGKFTLFVSNSKPPAVVGEVFTGMFQGGSGGTLQEQGGESGETFDAAVHEFKLQLPNLVTDIALNFSSNAPGAEVAYRLNRDGAPVLEETTGAARLEGLQPGTYALTVELKQGLQVEYEVAVDSVQDMDPRHLYEAP